MAYTIAECTVNNLLMMDRRTVRNMQNLMPKYIREISASSWFYYKRKNIHEMFLFSSFSLADW